MKVVVTAIGLLIYGPLDENSPKLNVFHVKFDDIKAVELDAHTEGGELIIYVTDQDTTINYQIFDDITYEAVQEILIRTWEMKK